MEKQSKGQDTILSSLVNSSGSSSEMLKAGPFLYLITIKNDDNLAIKHNSESVKQSMFSQKL